VRSATYASVGDLSCSIVHRLDCVEHAMKDFVRIVRHGRSIAFQMAEVAVLCALLRQILSAIAALRPPPCRSDVEDQCLSWPTRLFPGDARPDPLPRLARPVTSAIAAPQQKHQYGSHRQNPLERGMGKDYDPSQEREIDGYSRNLGPDPLRPA
jgi:hypothetical protein